MLDNKNKYVRGTYWSLIITFTILYLAIAFVSTLHAIAFFQLGNSLGMAIMLGAAYEIGQMAVLFSLLMTHHHKRGLAWFMMILLTSLQVTANVYATFKYMDGSGNEDWTFWQRSILFWVQAEGSEMYKIIIAWIQGALLPIVALGLTALVVDNIKLMRGDVKLDEYEDDDDYEYEDEVEEDDDDDLGPVNLDEEVPSTKNLLSTEQLKSLDEKPFLNMDGSESKINEPIKDSRLEVYQPKIEEEKTLDEAIGEQGGEGFEELAEIKDVTPKKKDPELKLEGKDGQLRVAKLEKTESHDEIVKDIEDSISSKEPAVDVKPITKPVNKAQGWHFKNRYIDNDRNVFSKGKYLYTLSKEELAKELAPENKGDFVDSTFKEGKEVIDLHDKKIGIPVDPDRKNWDKP